MKYERCESTLCRERGESVGSWTFSRRKEGNVDCEWHHKQVQLGSPEKARARERAVELMANGWEIETVLFRSGLWTFRRPRLDIALSTPVAPARENRG
jgi:hypothetical protein